MARPRKGVEYRLIIAMIDASNPAAFKSGETVTDAAYYLDGTGAWASLAISDTFSEIGSTGIYEITLSAAEMNHDQIMVKASSTNGQATYALLDLEADSFDSLGTDIDAILADTGTDGVAVSQTIRNAIADSVLRRSFANAKAASGPDAKTGRSLLGTVAKNVNKVAVSGSTLTVYEEDDATSLFTQTVTTDAGANPITAMDTD